MKLTLRPRDAIASHTCAIKKVKLHMVFMGKEDSRRGFWLEIKAENKKSFYDNYAVVGFGIVQPFWGRYDKKLVLEFDRELFEFETDIFKVLQENHSQASASKGEK
jgi:hypothetical protein